MHDIYATDNFSDDQAWASSLRQIWYEPAGVGLAMDESYYDISNTYDGPTYYTAGQVIVGELPVIGHDR